MLAAGLALPLIAKGEEQEPVVIDGVWRDAGRHREVPWRARWPAGSGACPLVFYSHGLGGSRDGGDAWCEAWCGAGIAVLHLQHPGSDTAALRGGLRALREAASGQQLAERVHDVRGVMDEVTRQAAAGVAPWSRVRAAALGVAGHSFGAHATQALAGQRYAVAAAFADVRPRAFIAFSPSSGRADALPPREAFGGITRPFFAVIGSLDGDPFGSYLTGEPRTLVHQGLPPGQRALLWLEGADHMTFAGNARRRIRSGVLFARQRVAEQEEARHHTMVARITSHLWRAQLLDDAEARRALAAPAGLGPGDRLELD